MKSNSVYSAAGTASPADNSASFTDTTAANKVVFISFLSVALIILSVLPDYDFLQVLYGKHYLISHLMIELISVFIFTSVVAIIFLGKYTKANYPANTLIVGFTSIALLDLIHATSYAGMPYFISESSVEKSIFFWLASRTVEVVTMLMVALQLRLRGNRYFWLAASFGLTLFITYLGTSQLALFPATYTLEQGVTAFKSYYEYGFIISFLAITFIFANRYKKHKNPLDVDFAISSYAMAMCSFFLTDYAKPDDTTLLIAHIFKIISGIYIFRILFITELLRPYNELKLAKSNTSKHQKALQTVLDNLPVGVMKLSADYRPLFVNKQLLNFEEFSSILNAEAPLLEQLPNSDLKILLLQAMTGRPIDSAYTFDDRNNKKHYRIIRIEPDNTAKSLLCVVDDVTEKTEAEQAAKRLALYDELTGLPNRRTLNEKLHRIKQESSPTKEYWYALFMLDLDNFKDVNDSLGHVAGDKLLILAAERIVSLMENNYTAARLGGDEFVILLEHLNSDKQQAFNEVSDFAQTLQTTLSQPYIIDNHELSCPSSIGISVFNNMQMQETEIMRQADVAMYKSKFDGKNAVTFFDKELQQTIDEKNIILRELSTAKSRDEFELYYQPIYNRNGDITCLEALIRWHSSVLGFVRPDKFIGLAEQSQLIVDIGEWVIEQACTTLATFKQRTACSDWQIAVNISARQLNDPKFTDKVYRILKQHKVNPKLLKLEITETMLQVDIEETIMVINDLKSLGLMFSLDDFGTGYSSFSYLTKLPIDTLKVDRSFVDKMLTSKEDRSVVETILSLSASLKLDVVAEGIETEEQMAFLKNLGCQYFQGYLLSKPKPLNELDIYNTQ